MGDIEALRLEVDELDEALIELIKERQKIAKKIGRVKKENDAPVLDKARWGIVLKRRMALAKRLNLPVKNIEKIWNVLHTMALEEETRNGK